MGTEFRVLFILGAVQLAAGGLDAVELKLRWEVGKRYAFQQDVNSSMEVVARRDEAAVPMNTNGLQRVSYTVADHPAGTKVDMRLESFRTTTTMKGQVMMQFDSENPGANGGAQAGALAALMEARVATVFDDEGKVVEILGLDTVKGGAQGGMSRNQLEAMAKHAALYLPAKEVKPGETWQTEVDLPLGAVAGQEASIAYTMTFEGMEEREGRSLARISLSGKLRVKAGAQGVRLPMEAKKLSGVIFFDPVVGQPIETNLSMEMLMRPPAGLPRAEGVPDGIPLRTATVQKLVAVEDAG